MQIEDITNDLMRMLELKLLEHVPTSEFNKNDLTRNVMNNILDNTFMKSLYELRKSGAINAMMPKQVIKSCLENAGQFLCDQPGEIESAFNQYLKAHQPEELFKEASEMGKYVIGALPLLIEEYIAKNEFFHQTSEN